MKNIITIYLSCIKETFLDLKRSPFIFINTILLLLTLLLGTILISILKLGAIPYLSGILLGILFILVLSVLYSMISDISRGRKVNFSDLKSPDFSLFNPIINAGFMIFLASFALEMFHNQTLSIIFNFLIVICFNAIPETIIVRETYGGDTFLTSFEFIKKNWIVWFIPQIILIAIFTLFHASYSYILSTFASQDVLVPNSSIFFKNLNANFQFLPISNLLSDLLFSIFAVILFVFNFVFRVKLYRKIY